MAVNAITDYSSLQAAVADYLVRSDLTTEIQLAIKNAENEFNRVLRVRQMETKLDTTTVAGQTDYSFPSDLVEIRFLRLITSNLILLNYRTPMQLQELYWSQSTGQPESYTLFASEITLAPPPDGAYVLSCWYYASIPALSSGTNWLITKHPDLYLYATLVQMGAFVDDQRMLSRFVNLYQAAMMSLNDESYAEDWNGAPLSPTIKSYCP